MPVLGLKADMGVGNSGVSITAGIGYARVVALKILPTDATNERPP